MKSLDELAALIEQWAEEKGITGPRGKGTVHGQTEKMLEEANELFDEIEKRTITQAITQDGHQQWVQNCNLETGDVFVTLVVLCKLRKQSFASCVEDAYNKISNRTGKMVNGQFVKD